MTLQTGLLTQILAVPLQQCKLEVKCVRLNELEMPVMVEKMDQKALDDLLCGVLLNSSKTQAFLKRLRSSQPEKWQRVFGNISLAYHLLAPRQCQVTVFLIGVFDPLINESWPWHCHYEHGIYLSEKYRQCKRWKAAEFETAKEAREFFHNWKGKKHLKMELIEVQQTKTIESYI